MWDMSIFSYVQSEPPKGSRPDGLEVWKEFCLSQPAPHVCSFYSYSCPHHPGHGRQFQRSLQDGPVAESGLRALLTACYACYTFNTVAYDTNYYKGGENIQIHRNSKWSFWNVCQEHQWGLGVGTVEFPFECHHSVTAWASLHPG